MEEGIENNGVEMVEKAGNLHILEPRLDKMTLSCSLEIILSIRAPGEYLVTMELFFLITIGDISFKF